MARKRKPGKRTRSGRLSRAYLDPNVRDMGTPEVQAKRRALVGEGSALELSATAPGVLHAHAYLDKDQYAEALEYRRLRCALYGPPWPMFSTSSGPTEERIARLQERFDRMAAALTEEQKRIITDVAVLDRIPTWFFCLQLKLKMLPEDYAEQEALVTGLDAMLGRAHRKAA
jgi:hypothetical protein